MKTFEMPTLTIKTFEVEDIMSYSLGEEPF